jgi:thiamine monophosphate kinase
MEILLNMFLMKTTIDISDSLLRHAKQLAHKQHLTLRILVEEGLSKVIEEREHGNKHSIEPVVFGGDGLSSEFKGASWRILRGIAYGDHCL